MCQVGGAVAAFVIVRPLVWLNCLVTKTLEVKTSYYNLLLVT